MKVQRFGSTDLEVSRLCLGTWQMSGDWGHDYDDAVGAVRVAYELGINFFDTAYAYGQGAAERALARGLGDLVKSNRDQLVIASKGGIQFGTDPASVEGDGPSSGPAFRNSDRSFLRRTLIASLRNLGVDHLDIYFVHWPDPAVPAAETAGALGEFIDEGLVRYAGLSNHSKSQMTQFAMASSIGAAQLPYNLLDRRSEHGLIPFCAERGIGVMGWGPLAHGVLTGAIRRDRPLAADDWRSQDPLFKGEGFGDAMDLVDELTNIARDYDITLPQLALAWILANPTEIVPVVGAQMPQHIIDSAKAVDVQLPRGAIDRVADVTAGIPPFYSRSDREIGVREDEDVERPTS